jgi:signal transduction histidine kinase
MARRRSARLRLTLWYGGLVFATGALLLAFTFVLVSQSLTDPSELNAAISERIDRPVVSLEPGQPRPSRSLPVGDSTNFALAFSAVQRGLIDEALNRLLTQSVVALAVMSVASLGVGWVMAGRALRPLSDITATARRLSQDTLHDRIALQGPEDELKELADTFDAMLARLDAAFTGQREFVANASHELRTPLSIIRAELDVTLSDPAATAEDLRRMAATIRLATDRSERLIDSLLTLARADGELASRELVDLADVVSSAETDARLPAQIRGIGIELNLAPAPVRGDRALLERLAGNLFENAIRHNSDAGWIRAATSVADGHAVMVVANGGARLDPDDARTLFERFRRLDRARSRALGGVGLGLSIVRAVATAHGGSARLHALPTGGLSVEVRIPLTPLPASPPPAKVPAVTRT